MYFCAYVCVYVYVCTYLFLLCGKGSVRFSCPCSRVHGLHCNFNILSQEIRTGKRSGEIKEEMKRRKGHIVKRGEKRRGGFMNRLTVAEDSKRSEKRKRKIYQG